jgi:hypothetical protein
MGCFIILKKEAFMSKKLFNLIVGIIGGVSAIAIAIVTFVQPAYCVAINAAIPIATTAITEILSLFVKEK